MTHVHYKFSSKLSYDTVVFDGPHITLEDLKRQIMGREKLRAGDCDLLITNAQTREEYTGEDLIPKGSSVIVRRIPVTSRAKSSSNNKTHIERSDIQSHHSFGTIKAMDNQSSSRTMSLFSKMANLATVDVPEVDKLKVMMNQSIYDPMNYSKKLGAVLPANYTCYRCGNTGHHIRNCPTSGDKNFEAPLRIKKSTGIPRSFMVEVDDPNIKGAMLTSCGRYAIPAIDAEAYAIGKRERPQFLAQQAKSGGEDDVMPDELLCLLCRNLLSDAVVIPCCGNSYCDECIRTNLLDSEEHTCPTCGQLNVSPDTLIANKFLRQAVNNFKKEIGFTKTLRSATSQFKDPTLIPSPAPTLPLTMSKTCHSTSSQQTEPTPRSVLSPVSGTPQAVTVLASSNMLSTSLQIPGSEAEGKTYEVSTAAAQSLLLSNNNLAISSEPITLANYAPVMDQTKSVNVKAQHFFSGQAWEYPGASSGLGRSVTESNSSLSSNSTIPSLFPSPHYQSIMSAQQHLSSYPPEYPHFATMWPAPTAQTASIPSVSSSTVPALISKEWFSHNRNKRERSLHKGSTYQRSSHSESKSSKSKLSWYYSLSRSESRSRSRSRSQDSSRSHSPKPRPRVQNSHSYSRSYSYGYKRSHSSTRSSSSSPRTDSHSGSKPSSDNKKSRHSSSNHNSKSSSSSSNSRRQAKYLSTSGSPLRMGKNCGPNLTKESYSHLPNQAISQESDTNHYLQWKRQYNEWCEKYFRSFVSHSQHQSPLPPLPPTSQPLSEHAEGSYSCSLNAYNQPQSRCTKPVDHHYHPSQSSSESRTSPSWSSSDSRSPSSQKSDSHSPCSSIERCFTVSKDGACKQTSTEHISLPITLPKISNEVERNPYGMTNLKEQSTLTHENVQVEKHIEETVKESFFTNAADATENRENNIQGYNNSCKKWASPLHEADTNYAIESVWPDPKPKTTLNADLLRQSRKQNNLKMEYELRRGQILASEKDEMKPHKVKPVKEEHKARERQTNPENCKTSDSRSQKRRKGREEDMMREPSLTAQTQSSKGLLTNQFTEGLEIHKSESQQQLEREKKQGINTWPVTQKHIWEAGIKVKPQKKISINISLGEKRRAEKTVKHDFSYSEWTEEKSEEANNMTGIGENEWLNRGKANIQIFQKQESNSKQRKSDAKGKWEKATFRDEKEMACDKDGGSSNAKNESRDQEDVNIMQFYPRGSQDRRGIKASTTDVDRKSVMKKEEKNDSCKKDRLFAEMLKVKAGDGCMETIGNTSGQLKIMEKVKIGVREDDSMFLKSQSIHERPNTLVNPYSPPTACRGSEYLQKKTPEEHATLGDDNILP